MTIRVSADLYVYKVLTEVGNSYVIDVLILKDFYEFF